MAANIDVDVENDGVYLRHLLHDTGRPEIGGLIKRALDNAIPRKAIDFRTNVARVITQCLQTNGVPMFRTRYAKQPFPENTVLVVCYLGRLKGTWLKNTPPEDMQLLRSKADGYTLMLRKYGQTQAFPVMPSSSPYETVRLGGAASYSGQAMVSEPVNELEYFIDGIKKVWEDFETAWLREFPGKPRPSKPGYFQGRTHTFTITVPFKPWPEKETTPLIASLKFIEESLGEALADEEKAVPSYETLLNGIKGTRGLVPRTEPEKERSLFTVEKGIESILTDERKHKDRIKNMIPIIQETRRKLE